MRKRSKSSNGFDELANKINKSEAAYEKTTDEISGITTFFKQEVEATERRANIFTEIMHLEGFTKDELLTVREHISKKKHKPLDQNIPPPQTHLTASNEEKISSLSVS
ncbi:hypothetical protein PTKIN_Ptkin03bG0131900 [Pterospermum kingtungense]